MTRDELWSRMRALWETTERSAAAAVKMSAPAWVRLRTMWDARGGRTVALPPEPEPELESELESEVKPTPAPRRSRASSELSQVDEAIEGHDAEAAMRLLQPMLLEEHVGAEVLKRAARVMRLLDEDAFAVLFDAAAASPATGPAIDLASCFFELDDARMALAMARMALQRGGHDDPMVHALIAEGHARQGDHAGVIEALERFHGDWPEPTLLRRYALSTVLAGDEARWNEVSDELGNDRCASWILSAADRMAKYPLAGSEEEWYRWLLFAEYGALLIEPTPVSGLTLRPHVVARIIHAVRDAVELLEVAPDRIAYVSKPGEVFARWLARQLDVMPIPLSARITGQSLLVVAADDRDLERVVEEPRYSEGPVTLFQLVKTPRYSGVPAPDIIGLLGTDVTLPIQPVVARMAADRLPPRLMVAEIERQAEPMLALEGEPDGSLDAWIVERREDLSVACSVEPSQRSPYVADMAQPPVVDEAHEPEDEADVLESAEAEVGEASLEASVDEHDPMVSVITETIAPAAAGAQMFAELDEEFDAPPSPEAPPAS